MILALSNLVHRISCSLQCLVHWIRDSLLSLGSDLALHLQQCTHAALLLADEGQGIDLSLPLFGDGDGVLLSLLIRNRVPLRVRMFDDGANLFWED